MTMTVTATQSQPEADSLSASGALAVIARDLEKRSFAATGKHKEALERIVSALRKLARATRAVED